MDRTYLDWPFFAPEHRDLARQLDAWAPQNLSGLSHGSSNESVDADCRELVKRLASGGFTRIWREAELEPSNIEAHVERLVEVRREPQDFRVPELAGVDIRRVVNSRAQS
jgi:hypothetical protein